MNEQIMEIVIEKEQAVFRMDANGCWHNQHGRFQHKKVIDYFHTCIRKDRHGFYLSQQKEDCLEKVYFPYEETAYFVFDVVAGEKITLFLNTKKQLELNPDQLYIKDDCLYVYDGKNIVKFTDRSMMKLSAYLEEKEDGFILVLNGKRSPIKTTPGFTAAES